mgnify:FL=1
MGTTLVEQETKVATALGFFQSHLSEKGETFVAPVSFKAKWFVSQADLASGEVAIEAPRFLDGAAKDIVAELPNKTTAEITALIAEEQAGKARKGLLAIMSDAVANRAGEIVQPEENPFA